jgi:hypothetical protein
LFAVSLTSISGNIPVRNYYYAATRGRPVSITSEASDLIDPIRLRFEDEERGREIPAFDHRPVPVSIRVFAIDPSPRSILRGDSTL